MLKVVPDAPLELGFLDDSFGGGTILRNPDPLQTKRIVLRFMAFFAKKVDGDPAQPSLKTRFETKIAKAAKSLDHGFLGNVVGLGGIRRHLIHQVVEIFLIETEYFVKRLGMTVPGRLDQGFFVGFHGPSSVSTRKKEISCADGRLRESLRIISGNVKRLEFP